MVLAFLFCLAADARQAFAQRGAKDDNGYIDSAVIGSCVRFRYDVIDGVEVIDRARYYFPSARRIGDRATATEFGGPPEQFQELKSFVQVAFHRRFSIFGEFPARYASNAFAVDPLTPGQPQAASPHEKSNRCGRHQCRSTFRADCK
jgi:hypothetical protein